MGVPPRNTFEEFIYAIGRAIDGPTTWFRGKINLTSFLTNYIIIIIIIVNILEKVVLPNQKHYPWYHQKFRRVPTIDECYTDDVVCVHEANMQYKRDR